MGQGVSPGLSPHLDPVCWGLRPLPASQGKGCVARLKHVGSFTQEGMLMVSRLRALLRARGWHCGGDSQGRRRCCRSLPILQGHSNIYGN